MFRRLIVTGNVFMGEGKYGDAVVVKSKLSHAETLQHNLRDMDKRECLIAGVTPWRALMQPLQDHRAETYTALLNDEPVMMFGIVPEHELVASIWMLCSEKVNRYPKTFLKWSPAFVDYFQQQFYLLQNVCPSDHEKTLSWLEYLGFVTLPDPIDKNGYEVLRFVRCQDFGYVQSLYDNGL